MQSKWFEKFCSAILAGICISLGCWVNLSIGGIEGAVLFAFGLLAVVHYGLDLYTGKAGFFENKSDFCFLFTAVLLGNIVGCYLTSLLSIYNSNIISHAQMIVSSRAQLTVVGNFALAIPCGFIMTTAVQFAREGKYLPLLFGVPLFILSGFVHCIADALYYFVAEEFLSDCWCAAVFGNLLGCNLYRIIKSIYISNKKN